MPDRMTDDAQAVNSIKTLVKVSKVDYGLFRASRSLPHYALIVGRVNTPFSHCKQACVGDGLLTL